jgi:hypothetical protein
MSALICETSRRGTLSAYDTTFPWAADPATAIIEMHRSGYDCCTELIVVVTLVYRFIVILVLLLCSVFVTTGCPVLLRWWVLSGV